MKITKIIRTPLPLMAVFLFACSESKEPQPDPSLVQGEAIVKQYCRACHAQGINGAPIIGNAKMWGPRVGKGQDALVANAISGIGLMPAKAGKPDQLTDEDMALAVQFMLSQIPK